MENEFKDVKNKINEFLNVYKYMVENDFDFLFRYVTLEEKMGTVTYEIKEDEKDFKEITLIFAHRIEKDIFRFDINYNFENNKTVIEFYKNRKSENFKYYKEEKIGMLENFNYIVDDVRKEVFEEVKFFSDFDEIRKILLMYKFLRYKFETEGPQKGFQKFFMFFQYNYDKIIEMITDVYEAYRLKKYLIDLNFDEYASYSEKFESAIESITSKYSIKREISDEAFIKLSDDGKLEYFEEDGKKYYPFKMSAKYEVYVFRFTGRYTLKGCISTADNNAMIFINKEK